MTIIEISLTDIILDQRLQMREKMDAALIDDYAEHIDKLPPGKVIRQEEQIWLTDGFHTYRAHAKVNRPTMKCEVAEGTFTDALAAAAGANHGHGLRRTTEDKKKAVLSLLNYPFWEEKSDRKLAELAHVAHTFVAKVRANWKSQTIEIEDDEESGVESTHENTVVYCPACARRNRVGQPLPRRCADCAELRTADPEPPLGPEEVSAPPPVRDNIGMIVPQRLIPVFKMVDSYERANKQLNSLGKTCKEIEESPCKEAKPLDPTKPFEKFYTTLKSFRWRVRMMRPALVCQNCEGDGCGACKDKGWLTFEEAEAKGAK